MMNRRTINTKPGMCAGAALKLALLLGLVLYGCPTEAVDDSSSSLPATEGYFTLSGLESHNGKYAFIREKGSSGDVLFGMSDVTVAESTIVKGVEITDGVAEIPLYLYYFSDSTLNAFEESGTAFSNVITVYVSSQEEYAEGEIVRIPAHAMFYGVNFNGGSVSKALKEAGSSTL